MGNIPINCQQCNFQRPEPTQRNNQHTRILVTELRTEPAIVTEKEKVANQITQTSNNSNIQKSYTPINSYIPKRMIQTVTMPAIQFAHRPEFDKQYVRFQDQAQSQYPQQLHYHPLPASSRNSKNEIIVNEVRSRESQGIINGTQVRYPSLNHRVSQINKISFNYTQPQQQNIQRVSVINQPNFQIRSNNQHVQYSSQQISFPSVQKRIVSNGLPMAISSQAKPEQQINIFGTFLQNNPNIVKSEVKDLTFLIAKPTKQVKCQPRQLLQSHVNLQQTFLTHHLKYELSLTNYTNMKRIRKRQIMQHIWLESQWQNFITPRDLKIKFSSYSESIISAWMQRTFLQIWQQAHNDFFTKHLDYKFVRYKVAQQYMHQIYQLKQFADCSAANLNFMFCSTQFDLNTFLQYSDDSLLHLFKKLKDRYPQTSSKEKMQFPDVPTTKTSLNILDHFPALSFTDPNNLNYQTIYEDINFLLSKAMEEQDGFKQDMKEILGADVLGCTKVGQVTKDGKSSFNACAVRRVFVKWAQNILQKCPDLFQSRSFMRFVQTRGKIANNFIFKSSVQDSTHKFVIDCVSLLLQAAKFSLKDNDIQKREQFIFNIYDLLRCKIKRGTPQEIVDLLEKMKSTSVTKNGKKFEVIRVKNRFNTNNRDLLINFRYGDVLIGEAQLCVDNAAQLNKEAKLNYDFCHYIYQLQRSIFGPTLELMMEYEDYQRPDIAVTFEAEDVVQGRQNQKIQKLENINRKCIQGHKMVSIVGNVIFSTSEDQEQQEDDALIICNYCDSRYPCSRRYDYCYLCGCMLCTDCRQIYEKANKNTFYLSVQSKNNIPSISSQLELQQLCQLNTSMILLFWLENSSSSEMLRDGLVYQQSKQIMQPNKFIPRIAMVKYSNEQAVGQMMRKYKISQFPTMILMDSRAAALKTVIGCSWFQVPVFYTLQQKMVQQQTAPKATIYCIDNCCKKQMFLNEIDGQQELTCQICFSHSKLHHFPQELRNKGFFCQDNHYQCINCCYINFDMPTTHQDFMGESYLSSSFTKTKIQKCFKGHSIQMVYQNYPTNYVFKCSGCQRQSYIDNQHGVGQCIACKINFCNVCLGVNQPTYHQLQTNFELVSHSVQSTAEDSYLCVCKRFFKKTYQKRYLHQQELIKADRQAATWTCKLCDNSFKQGQLHIACFCCPELYDEQSGQSSNFQICYKCALKSKIIRQNNNKNQKQRDCHFTCPQDKLQMVFTSFGYNKQLTFNCYFCDKNFYRNSSRFYCKQCGLNVCRECRDELEKQHFNPPACQQTCPNKHSLQFQFVKQAKHLQFCDGCMCTLLDEKYICEEDNYALCASCTQNNPATFKGTALSRARELASTFVDFFKSNQQTVK